MNQRQSIFCKLQDHAALAVTLGSCCGELGQNLSGWDIFLRFYLSPTPKFIGSSFFSYPIEGELQYVENLSEQSHHVENLSEQGNLR